MLKLQKELKVIFAVASVTYKEWAAYRTHSLVSVFVGPAHFLVAASIWRAVYSKGGAVGGMTLDEIILYYAVSTLISYLVMDFADWNLQMLVSTGKYITFALRPLHHRSFALYQKLGHRALGFLFEFLPVLAVFILFFDIKLQAAWWPWALLSVALAFFMRFYINDTIGLAAFWFVKTDGLRGMIRLLTDVCSGLVFPLAILPGAVQGIVFFLPFQYTLYVPSMVFMGGYRLGAYSMDMPAIVAVQAGYVLLFFGLSELFYRLGMKRFTAVGV
jgi:ABC-2 type transport system permease protein